MFFVMGLTASCLILVRSCVREVSDPAHGLVQWLLGTILDASWAGQEVAGVRIYPEGSYRGAFGVCLALAVGSLAMTLLVTETRRRNIWRRAAH